MTRKPTVVGIGEILWDVFPEGPRFGGAPANFACHVASLLGHAHMVGAVGTDELGDMALAALERRHVSTTSVDQLLQHSTGSVQVEIDENGQARYEFHSDEAWDHIAWSDQAAELARYTNAVCFGTLAQRALGSRQSIQRFVEQTPQKSLRIFDINLRPPYCDNLVIEQSLNLASILKLNDDELEVLASAYGLSGTTTDCMRELARRFDLQLIALSRGEYGAILMQADNVSEFPGIEVAVKDTVGAGDAFTAALTVGLLAGLDLETMNQRACEVAAYVCTQSGATPEIPQELTAAIQGSKQNIL